MKKTNKSKIILFLCLIFISVVSGIVIQLNDQQYKSFFVEKRPAGEVLDEAPTPSDNSIVEENGKICVNINTATIHELDKLDGIGEKMAQRIIDYRNAHGNFEVIEDIMRVSGIGEKKFENIKDNICVE